MAKDKKFRYILKVKLYSDWYKIDGFASGEKSSLGNLYYWYNTDLSNAVICDSYDDAVKLREILDLEMLMHHQQYSSIALGYSSSLSKIRFTEWFVTEVLVTYKNNRVVSIEELTDTQLF